MASAALPFPAAAPRSHNPLAGVAAVLLGAIISTLFGRVTTFGLADIRGAIGAGVDEGAWITTAATVGQMLMGVLSVWLGAAYGPRRVLLWGIGGFALACLAIPFAPDLGSVIALQFAAGLGSGTFVPLAISFVLRNLAPPAQVFGIAAYAMSLELSLNVPASLEGFYVEQVGWQWIFWQNVVLSVPMLWLVRVGMPREAVNVPAIAHADFPGIAFLGVGASLLYAALDQGDRLDWLGSGLITGLFAGGGLLIACFIVHEATTANPFFHFGVFRAGNMPKLAAILVLYRFALLATAFVVPQYLVVVQGYRALEVGDALLWIALPQFVLAPVIALLLRRFDARLLIAIGLAAIGIACVMVAHGLTRDWVSADFIPSQLIQALGQSFGLTAFIWFATRHLVPEHALTFGAFIQTFRLLGGELGVGAMTWFVRTREQMHSNLLGQHVLAGGAAQGRIAGTAAGLLARSDGPAAASARAMNLLARAVQQQAYVLAFIDAMALVAAVAVASLLLVAWLEPAPHA
jgi:DHA2 family multidrug resistance protein